MSNQEKTGWVIVGLILLAFWWLTSYGLGLLHGTSVQTTLKAGGTSQTNTATTTCDNCD